jgi:hypothetical protein
MGVLLQLVFEGAKWANDGDPVDARRQQTFAVVKDCDRLIGDASASHKLLNEHVSGISGSKDYYFTVIELSET